MYLNIKKKRQVEKLYTLDELGDIIGKSKQRIISTLTKLHVVYWNYGVLTFGKNYENIGLGTYVMTKHIRKADGKLIIKRELAFTERGKKVVEDIFYHKNH